MFNWSLQACVIPNMWKTSILVPVPKKSNPKELNDLRPVALTPIFMKCLEKIVLKKLLDIVNSSLDSLQFAYKKSVGVEDAVLTLIDSLTSHLEKRNTYCRIMYLDFSSAFNTMKPDILKQKLQKHGVSVQLQNWIWNFLVQRPQIVRNGSKTSNHMIVNTGAPQGCCLSPVLYTIYTDDCRWESGTTKILKYADDTAIIGLIEENDETTYRDCVKFVENWSKTNMLTLNPSKCKEQVIDFRKKSATPTRTSIGDNKIDIVSKFKYLGVTISSDLSWKEQIDLNYKKARQRMHMLSKLSNLNVSGRILSIFYTGMVESIVQQGILTWYGYVGKSETNVSHKKLKQITKRAKRITKTAVTDVGELYKKRLVKKVNCILKNVHHPLNKNYVIQKYTQTLRMPKCRTNRYRYSFFPNSVTLYNTI